MYYQKLITFVITVNSETWKSLDNTAVHLENKAAFFWCSLNEINTSFCFLHAVCIGLGFVAAKLE
jgi:hypothetical protein